MEFVINEPESVQSIRAEQIDHGKFARIFSTSFLLNVGVLGPALRAGSPVSGFVTNLSRCARSAGVSIQFARSQCSHPADSQDEYQAGDEADQAEQLALSGNLGLDAKTISRA